MATIGRPKADIALTDDERDMLQAWARRPTTAQRLALRARIVLVAADVKRSNTEVVADLGVTRPTVGKRRQRFIDLRLDGRSDELRPGAPRTISDAQVEAVVARTLESKPKNATHWSTRGMAEAAGLSQTAVSRIWRAFGLRPPLAESFKLSTGPMFVDPFDSAQGEVRDVVGLYLNPPERAIVLSVDEKSQVQAFGSARGFGTAHARLNLRVSL